MQIQPRIKPIPAEIQPQASKQASQSQPEPEPALAEGGAAPVGWQPVGGSSGQGRSLGGPCEGDPSGKREHKTMTSQRSLGIPRNTSHLGFRVRAMEHLHRDDWKHGERPRRSEEVMNGFLGSYRGKVTEVTRVTRVTN